MIHLVLLSADDELSSRVAASSWNSVMLSSLLGLISLRRHTTLHIAVSQGIRGQQEKCCNSSRSIIF